jgi:hypothetical protein
LAAFVRSLASKPGVAGIVFRQTTVPGYDHAPKSQMSSNKPGLGYTQTARLASLRQQHIDPIDLEPEGYYGSVLLDLPPLPEFDDYAVEADAVAQWNAYRYSLDLAFMRKMFEAAQASGPREIWVAQRREYAGGDWYGLWTRADAPLPEIPEDTQFNYDPNRNYAAIAHAQSPLAVAIVSVWNGEDAVNLAQALKDLKPGWDGIVFDGDADGLKTIVKSLAGTKGISR